MSPAGTKRTDDDDHGAERDGARTGGYRTSQDSQDGNGDGARPGPTPKAVRPRPPATNIGDRTLMLLDSAQVAHRLGVTERLIRRLVAERRITFVRVGRYVRFDPDDIDAWIDAAKVAHTATRHHGGAVTRGTRP